MSFFWRSKEPTKFKCGTDPNNLKHCGVGQSGNWSAKNLTDGEHEFYVEALQMNLEIRYEFYTSGQSVSRDSLVICGL